jgi:hypothetical protein
VPVLSTLAAHGGVAGGSVLARLEKTHVLAYCLVGCVTGHIREGPVDLQNDRVGVGHQQAYLGLEGRGGDTQPLLVERLGAADPFETRVIQRGDGQGGEQDGADDAEGVDRLLAPAGQRPFLVQAHHQHEGVGEGDAIGGQYRPAVFRHRLELAGFPFDHARQHLLAAARRPRSLAFIGTQQQTSVITQELHQTLAGGKVVAVEIQEVVGVHRRYNRRPAVAGDAHVTCDRNEADAGDCAVKSDRAGVVKVTPLLRQADAQHLDRSGRLRQEIGPRQPHADIAGGGTGDHLLGLSQQGHRTEIGGLAQRDREVVGGPVFLGHIQQRALDDVEALGQVVFQRTRGERRRGELLVDGFRAQPPHHVGGGGERPERHQHRDQHEGGKTAGIPWHGHARLAGRLVASVARRGGVAPRNDRARLPVVRDSRWRAPAVGMPE